MTRRASVSVNMSADEMAIVRQKYGRPDESNSNIIRRRCGLKPLVRDGSKGGNAYIASRTPEEITDAARHANQSRWPDSKNNPPDTR